MLTEVPFYFLRHGQTDWNKQGRVQGRTDIPLNATGLQQAAHASRALAGRPIATICTSPLVRARQTAVVARDVLECDLHVVDDLAECDWGAMQGQLEDPAVHDWVADWRAGVFVPDGAESNDRFIDRAIRAINTSLRHPGPVLVVAHGGIYWSVQKHAALGPIHDIPNATPLHHMPPHDGHPWWTATVVGQSASE